MKRKLEELSKEHCFKDGKFSRTPEELRELSEEVLPNQDPKRREILVMHARMNDIDEYNRYLERLIQSEFPFMSNDQKLAQITHKTGADGVLMSAKTKAEYVERKVDLGIKASPLLDLPHQDDSLPIITGESGSGKTWLMINDKEKGEVALYLVAGTDFEWKEEQWSGQEEEKTSRDDAANQLMSQVVPSVLDRIDSTLRQLLEGKKLLILLDELGSWPTFVRALCSQHNKLRAHIVGLLSLLSCRLVIAGTGIYAEKERVRSLPAKFSIHTMPSKLDVWNALTLQTLGETASFPKAFVLYLNNNPTANRLMQNARFAALAFQWIKQAEVLRQVMGDRPSPRALESLLPIFFGTVAMTYRSKNAMSRLTSAEMSKLRHLTLAVVLFPHLEEHAEIKPRLSRFVTKFGVLVDRATFDSDTGKWDFPTPRFEMPPAQVELFRLGYGFQPATNTCVAGEGFKKTTIFSHYLEALLLASQGILPLAALLVRLGSHPQLVLADSLNTPLDYRGVRILQSQQRIEPAAVSKLQQKDPESKDGWFEQVQATLADNIAVILMNTPKASFADIIVLIPKLAVILVQAKSYNKCQLSTAELLVEVGKMGLVTPETNLATYVSALEVSDFPADSPFLHVVHETKLEKHLRCTQPTEVAGTVGVVAKVAESPFAIPTTGKIRRKPLREHLMKHNPNEFCVECKEAGVALDKARVRCITAIPALHETLCKLADVPDSRLFYALMTTNAKRDDKLPAQVLQFQANEESLRPIGFTPTKKQQRFVAVLSENIFA